MPISETIEAAYLLEDKVGMRLGPLVVNGVDLVPSGLEHPAAEAAAAARVTLGIQTLATLESARLFRLRRRNLQAGQLERLARELPIPQLHLPALSAPHVGVSELEQLSSHLSTEIEELPIEEVPQ
jgi:hypothetical protein